MIVVDTASAIPPFEQVRAQIADQIRAGILVDDARLPSVRQLAADLALAPGTVARAYRLLEAEGLVTTNRASGTRVRPGNALPTDTDTAVNQYIHAAKANGLTMDEALSAIRARW